MDKLLEAMQMSFIEAKAAKIFDRLANTAHRTELSGGSMRKNPIFAKPGLKR